MKEMVVHPYIRGDLALAFDGDGDRLGVVDNHGNDIWSDRLLIPMAASVLKGAQRSFHCLRCEVQPCVIGIRTIPWWGGSYGADRTFPY